MKRILSVFLVMILSLSLMPIAGLAADEPYTYTMVMRNFGPLYENPKMVEYWNNEYGVNFDLVYVEDASAGEQINLMVAGGEIPDVLQYVDQQSYFEQGIIGGWTEEFFRENAPNLSKYIDEVNPAAWNYAKFDGELMYAIPGFRMYNTIATPIILRTDWLKNVGIDEMPRTLEEYEKAFYAFVNDDPDGNGVKDTYALSKTGLDAIYGAFGMQRNMWLPDGNGGVLMGDVMPEAREALTLLAKWYKDGLIDPEFITGENQGGYWAITHAFLNNRIGMTGMGQFYHWVDAKQFEGGVIRAAMPTQWAEVGQTGTYAPGYAPVGPAGKSGTILPNTTTLRTVFSAKLVSDAPRFARLLQIIDDMNCSTVEKSALAARGMPGEEHDIIDWNGVRSIMLKPGVTLNDTLNGIGAANWFAFIEESGNFEYQKVAYAQEFYWFDHMMADKNVGYTSAIFGALPSQTLHKSECDKILNEAYVAIITGDQPIDYFDEMVKQWYNAGGTVLTQEASALYQQQTAK